MSLIVKGDSKEFEKMPTGTQQAVCAFVEDLGTHEMTYQGETKRRRQIVIVWELEEKMTEGEFAGKPFTISKFYTHSLDKKSNLSKDLQSWFSKEFTPEQRREGFDLKKLIGNNCLLSISEKSGSKYSIITGVMPLPKNMQKINVIGKNPPAWVQKVREQSIEWREEHGNEDWPDENQVTQEHHEDDLPF